MAQTKITQLPASSGLVGTDLVPVVDDPSGTPVTQKATWTQVRNFILASDMSLAGELTVTSTTSPQGKFAYSGSYAFDISVSNVGNVTLTNNGGTQTYVRSASTVSTTLYVGDTSSGAFTQSLLVVGSNASGGPEASYLNLYGGDLSLTSQQINFDDAAAGSMPLIVGRAWDGVTTTLTIGNGSGSNVLVASLAAAGSVTLGSTSNRQIIIAGSGWGAGNASLRLNGLTSGAGVATGTLTNAPSAGNPNFWIPVSIAGTVRYIPAW